MGLAFLQYVQDNDEQMLMPSDAYGQGWANIVYPYTKSAGIFGCPDDPTAPTVAGYSKVSYAANWNIVASTNIFGPAAYPALSYIENSIAQHRAADSKFHAGHTSALAIKVLPRVSGLQVTVNYPGMEQDSATESWSVLHRLRQRKQRRRRDGTLHMGGKGRLCHRIHRRVYTIFT